jgi:UDP-glucose 4-epimerase
MRVLLTGAFGNVGLSALEELINKGYYVRVFDIPLRRNQWIARKYKKKVELFWGDLRNEKTVFKALKDVDVVVHVAAIIPPLADKKPKFAQSVNVGGTLNIVKAAEKQRVKPKIIYTSSIAVYGDRRKNPFIKVTDPLNPNDDDEYAKQKIQAERIIKNSTLDWSIFRLTYIVSPKKLKMDPLMFKMPLDTKIEICHTRDVGLALANGVNNKNIWGKVLNIAGGERCRTTYDQYLKSMTYIFGLGKDFFPKEAFATSDFHCGYMDTKESQELLNYQRTTLQDYYCEVKKSVRCTKGFMKAFKCIIKACLLKRSPYMNNV